MGIPQGEIIEHGTSLHFSGYGANQDFRWRYFILVRDDAKGEPGSADYLYGEITESTHGRQPGTLASLAMSREKKTRALLAEMGIPPESAAVSLRAAARKALLESMPKSKAEAMTQEELLAKAAMPSLTTLQNALKALRAEERIERIGKGVNRDPYRYFLAQEP